MLTDPQKVFEKAEEMAARYKQMLMEQAEDGKIRFDDDLSQMAQLLKGDPIGAIDGAVRQGRHLP